MCEALAGGRLRRDAGRVDAARRIDANAACRLRSIGLPGLVLLAGVLLAGCGGGAQRSASSRELTPRSAAGEGPVRSPAGDWSALLRGPSHFGAAPVAGPTRGAIRWTRKLEGPIVPGPVTAGGVAYVASNAGLLHALDIASGRDRWVFNGGGAYGSDLSTAPTVLADGSILWPGPGHRLYALTSAGHLLWSLTTAGEPLSPIVDQPRDHLILADSSGRISAFQLAPNGRSPTMLWSRVLASGSYGNPVLAADGTIYQTAGTSLYALDPRGVPRWRVNTGEQVEVSAAVAENGVVVFGSNDSREYGVSAQGRVLWRHLIGNYTYSSPLALSGDRVIYGNHSGAMTTLDTRTGHVVSLDQASGQIWTAAAVDGNADVYFASRTGGIYGFARDSHMLFAIKTATTFASYPAIAPDGTLLVGGDDGVLRAIR